MARLFSYGRINNKSTINGRNHLPGAFVSAQGAHFGTGSWNAGTNDIEYGEPVMITAQNERGYGVKRVDATVTPATLGFTIRDLNGIRIIQAGTAEYVPKGIPLTVIPASAPKGWSILVPVLATATPAVGGKVYIQTGASSTVAGAVATVATNAIDSGWVFETTKFKPTGGSGEVAWITKA